MSQEIKNLKPEAIWRHFAEMCAIPHPSHHEEAIRQYVVDFAKKNGLECEVDSANNVIVRKPATPGMEDRKGLILQAHLDMVPQNNSDKKFDFTKDPIEAYVDGEWVTAKGTTLGADNGMGVAAALAVLESKDIKHGYLEGFFTATEEDGMHGVKGLKKETLKGDVLLNMDSEEEGELSVGCAGGLNANITFNYKEDTKDYAGSKAVRIEVKGLRGGHSGLEIIRQRANSNKIVCRLLRQLFKKYDLQLQSIDGGGLRNAIPREATATVLVPEKDVAALLADVAAFEKYIIFEYDGIEDEVSIKAVDAAKTGKVVEKAVAVKAVNAVLGCPDGVIKMSVAMPGLVQTSTNLARVVSEDGTIKVLCMLRSSADGEKEALAQEMAAVFELAGAEITFDGGYSGWLPNMGSAILKTMREGYKHLFGKDPKIIAMHAGLECGIIGGVYPKLDMISFGPTIQFPHSPDERVNIPSVEKFWKYLVYTVENAPKK